MLYKIHFKNHVKFDRPLDQEIHHYAPESTVVMVQTTPKKFQASYGDLMRTLHLLLQYIEPKSKAGRQ